jgi:hypothetical protein
VKLQGILENACYEYGSRTIKQVMERERWDCPQAVELNTWARILCSNRDRFQQADLEGLGKPFAELLDSLSHLRHTAVHRLRVSANGLEQFLVDAETLVELLQDDNCAKRLTRLRRDTQLTIGELKRNKDLLESKLKLKLQRIADQRAELDRLEHLAVEEMIREDKDYQTLAGANLDEAIQSSDTIIQSAGPTEVESESESDVETDVPPTSADGWVNEHNSTVQSIED